MNNFTNKLSTYCKEDQESYERVHQFTVTIGMLYCEVVAKATMTTLDFNFSAESEHEDENFKTFIEPHVPTCTNDDTLAVRNRPLQNEFKVGVNPVSARKATFFNINTHNMRYSCLCLPTKLIVIPIREEEEDNLYKNLLVKVLDKGIKKVLD